jgi:hypothetical protein
MSKVDTAIKEAVLTGVLNSKDGSATTISKAVTDQVQPVVDHLTNQEPWYRSRVTWGAIASIALPLLGAFGVSSDIIDADQFVALGLAVGTAAGGLLTLYGRWAAKKPIGQ